MSEELEIKSEREVWLTDQIEKHTNHITFLEREIEINTWLVERLKKELKHVKS